MKTRENAKIELAIDALVLAGTVRLRATGTSMLPAIWPGDVLTVRRHTIHEIQAGDVAVFRRGGRLIVHRVIQKNGDLVIAQGDAKWRADAPFREKDLLGRVVAIHRSEKEVGMAQGKTLMRSAMRAAFQSSHFFRQLAVQWNAVVEGSWK